MKVEKLANQQKNYEPFISFLKFLHLCLLKFTCHTYGQDIFRIDAQ